MIYNAKHRKLKIEQAHTPLITGVESGDAEV